MSKFNYQHCYNCFFAFTLIPTLWQVGRLANCHTQLTRLDCLACAVLVGWHLILFAFAPKNYYG